MIKLNDFEKYLIGNGLDKAQEEMIAEIKKTEEDGGDAIITPSFVEMTINELKLKLKLIK